MNKKKILFVLDSLRIGGAEKSLITLLSLLDYEKYEVDLQLITRTGKFLSYVPREVNILPSTAWEQYIALPLWKKFFKISLSWTRLYTAFILRTKKIIGREIDVFMWKTISPHINTLEKDYDVAIGYGQYLPSFFVVDKVNAKRRVGYVNTLMSPPESLIDTLQQNFKNLDLIVAVSQDAKSSIVKLFPYLNNRIEIIRDSISKSNIEKMAREYTPLFRKEANLKIATAARLYDGAKGMDILLKTALYLKNKGVNYHWVVMGNGGFRPQMDSFIREHHLEQNLLLLGETPNPYPYIKHATLYVQTSRFEGYGLALAEARLLNTPIVTTSYEGWEMQMLHLKNGYVAGMSPESVGDAIIYMLEHPELREAISRYQQTEPKGNPEEFEKFRKFVLQEQISLC